MPKTDSVSEEPIVMRWCEPTSGGNRYWHLARLGEDARYWGYVHIRTDALSVNRSFTGELPLAKYRMVRKLVASVLESNEPITNEVCGGVIGLGTRSKFATVLTYDSSWPASPNSEAFQKIIAHLEPFVHSAASVE